MKAYVYQAALYCEDCGKQICDQLDRAEKTPDDVNNESSYDSDDYPKGPYGSGGGEADCPQHCDNGDTCLNAENLVDSCQFSSSNPTGEYQIGVWLGNPLTAEGLKYTVQAILEGGDVAELWGQYYEDDYEDISRAVAAVELLNEYGFRAAAKSDISIATKT